MGVVTKLHRTACGAVVACEPVLGGEDSVAYVALAERGGERVHGDAGEWSVVPRQVLAKLAWCGSEERGDGAVEERAEEGALAWGWGGGVWCGGEWDGWWDGGLGFGWGLLVAGGLCVGVLGRGAVGGRGSGQVRGWSGPVGRLGWFWRGVQFIITRFR